MSKSQPPQSEELDDRLRKILQSPHRDSIGSIVMTFPTTKTLDQLKQAIIEGFRERLPKEFDEETMLPSDKKIKWSEHTYFEGYNHALAEVNQLLNELRGDV